MNVGQPEVKRYINRQNLKESYTYKYPAGTMSHDEINNVIEEGRKYVSDVYSLFDKKSKTYYEVEIRCINIRGWL